MIRVKFLLSFEEDESKAVFLENRFEDIIDFSKWVFDKKFVLVERHWEDAANNKYFVVEETVAKNEKADVNIHSYSENIPRFIEHLVAFCNGVFAMRVAYNEKHGYQIEKEKDVIYEEGSRYFKVLYRTQWKGEGEIKSHIHCFVDKTNGGILKAATYKAPAKGYRGNIFNENCLKGVNEYGANYRR